MQGVWWIENEERSRCRAVRGESERDDEGFPSTSLLQSHRPLAYSDTSVLYLDSPHSGNHPADIEDTALLKSNPPLDSFGIETADAGGKFPDGAGPLYDDWGTAPRSMADEHREARGSGDEEVKRGK